jgi:hypothetical protein
MMRALAVALALVAARAETTMTPIDDQGRVVVEKPWDMLPKRLIP